MSTNWLPIEDWLANALREHPEVEEVFIPPAGRRTVVLRLKNGVSWILQATPPERL